MIILCSRCNEALPDDALELAGTTLRGRCPACEQRLERPLAPVAETGGGEPAASGRSGPPTPRPDAATLAEEAGSAAELACPKCDEPAPADADDCRRCGLARSRFAGFAAQSEASVSPELRQAWQAVQKAWCDDAAHDRFVERAAAESAFAYAARCYRRADKEHSGERAAAQLERIQRMAEVTFLSTQAARQHSSEPEPYRGVVAMLFALLAIAGIAGLYVMWKGSGDSARPEPAAPQLRQPLPAPGTPFFQAPAEPAGDAQPTPP